MFFDPNGNPIAAAKWLNFYEEAYFLNGSNIGRRLNRTSLFIENQTCVLLNPIRPLVLNDFKLIMGWKMGVISQKKSEATGKLSIGQRGTYIFVDTN